MSNEYRDWMADQIQDLKIDLKKCMGIIYDEYPNDDHRITYILQLCQKYNINLYE